MRPLYFMFPVFITLILMACIGLGLFLFIPFLLPLAGWLGKFYGRFGPQESWKVFHFFHQHAAINRVLIFSGLFFLGCNFYLVYYFMHHSVTLFQGLMVIYGAILFNSNFSISLAHELMHRKGWAQRLMGKILLLGNGFFYLEKDHLFIHHPFVGTPNDPASALVNEPLYHYWVRSINGRMAILTGLGKNKWTHASLSWGTGVNLLICLGLLGAAWAAGYLIFLWLVLQFVGVTFIYETITYIQHYGLRRQKESSGKFEPVGLGHSWNCFYKYSVYFHYCMPIHAPHHIKELAGADDQVYPGPQFPKSFGRMVLLAFFPGAWFKTMNPKVNQVHQMRGYD